MRGQERGRVVHRVMIGLCSNTGLWVVLMPYIAIRQDGRIVKHKHSNMVGSCLHMKYC